MGQQVKSIIYSLFAWEEGTYVMSFGEKARGETAHQAGREPRQPHRPRRQEALQGRAGEAHPRARGPPDPFPAAGRTRVTSIELEQWEADLLAHADGTRTVAELIAFARRPEPVVQLTLASLLAVQALEKGPA